MVLFERLGIPFTHNKNNNNKYDFSFSFKSLQHIFHQYVFTILMGKRKKCF